jgi:quinol monooxygenase YgiN
MRTKLLLLVVLMMLSFSCRQKTTVMDQQAQQNTVQPSDGQKMIIAKLSIKPENTADFIKAAQGIIKSSNEEEGCIEYQLFQSPYDQTSFVFVEKYVNQAAIDHHFGAPYFKEFGSTISGWTNGPAEIKIYDISGERMPE